MAAGDFNGDGTSDVIVGASLDDNNSETDSGSAFIFFGSSSLSISIFQAANTRDSTRLAISPYAQVIPNDSYTFIGVSHPSLDTASTQIGLVIEVIGMRTTLNNTAGRASVFTVDAGETHRVFIVNQSHPTINSSNTDFQTAIDENVHLIPTVDTAQFGSIRVTTLDSNPNKSVVVNGKNTYKNLAQLSMWGLFI
ncbi:integrin alpha [Nitrospinae bacterium]|nr:integrin alpha [Nitrospinota bacterium]